MSKTPILLLHIILTYLLGVFVLHAQQNPQYTHYQFNPMTVNAGYTASGGELSAIGLYRSQWGGLDGAPKTITFGMEAPVNEFDGLGLSIIQDELGPAEETYLDVNYAHTLFLGKEARLGMGLKAGGRVLNLDWSKGQHRDQDEVFMENINSKILPTLGAGLFYYTNRSYFGISVPNFIPNQHYETHRSNAAMDRLHYYLIGGYVFDLGADLKMKPSFYLKYADGASLSTDVSANFLFYDNLSVGVNYRLEESVSGLMGFRLNNSFEFGYAYDYNTSDLSAYNSGTHEVFIRYRLVSKDLVLKSPRFF